MLKLSVLEIARIVSAEVFGNGEVAISASVETDSRKITHGSLFVAKRGEVTDGHLFIDSAIENGAVAVLVEHRVQQDIPQLVVADVVKALGLLAMYVVAEVKSKGKLQVIGVTGSNGKTTTKNMLREILSNSGSTVSPEESFNNEVGAPYSMLKINEQTNYLVVELGAGGPGSIRYLTQMCNPDIGIELKVGLAHAGEFGGIENTTNIKAELVEEISADSIALLNIDDTRVMQMQPRTKARIVSFGTNKDAMYRATDISGSIVGTSFNFHSPKHLPVKVQLRILGEHHVYNALASLASADLLGLDISSAITALESMQIAERWRMELGYRSDGLTVINDAYNASPESVRAALQTLAELGRQSGKKTVAVIGEMAELGEYSVAEHDAIGRVVVRLNLGQLVVVGSKAKMVHMGASLEGSWDGESKYFEQISEAEAYLREMLTGEEIVLVKSSKSANLRYLGDSLLEENK
ncbi:MAG: UDP-N-acetylmuramoyl-tripeptide--D-alanyl-D-alanine ligase [Rhodoluna sp.]|nr:UDP-N-acetylmuramoyl-tripeptide--D-alanyl-D-alanine ligase [Rhodoluna sp.]